MKGIRHASPQISPHDLPLDILPLILEYLCDQKDLHSCALVNQAFNRAATPLLYMVLDSRIRGDRRLYHPSSTLLKRPDLAKHVRHLTETGAVHGGLKAYYPDITANALSALKLCKNLYSFTWVDLRSSEYSEGQLLPFIVLLQSLSIRSITIRSNVDIGEEAWSQLQMLRDLKHVALLVMGGPPRTLKDWSESLGNSLTSLELDRCAGIPPTNIITVVSQYSQLRTLALKGMASHSIPLLLTYLPNLTTLDTEYIGLGAPRPITGSLPGLKHLTVRASSVDAMGPANLWPWILGLLPHSSLESFVLYAYSTPGQISVTGNFILSLAQTQGMTLKQFMIGMSALSKVDIECLSSKFPMLEAIECRMSALEASDITEAISQAKYIKHIKLHLRQLSYTERDKLRHLIEGDDSPIRPDRSLRILELGSDLFKGMWEIDPNVDSEDELVFRVKRFRNK